ncbi:DUF2490 domain-containing protein [Panacibacter ginsenosidivorans]|uniref:DUF2490 domain-containing protein n=1 Tax=Panacibacter ginsenosidivorans TaxID=1813871 RepID=UPI0013155A9D|nr:DUF2490 domain-containing protein [Panacibacter ginsenosidivorans]
MKFNLKARLALAAIFTVTGYLNSNAQTTAKKITTRPVAWYNYLNTLELSARSFITTQLSERTYLDNGHQAQALVWSKINHTLGEHWDAGLGFAYFLTRSFDPASTNTLSVPELRPFEEFNYKQKINKIALNHRYRIEERYVRKTENDKLTDGYNFSFRFRYQFNVDYNLFKSKDNTRSFSIKAGDEIIINAGRHIINNMFDQNRIFVSLNYQPVNNVSVELGYMNAFQERSSGNQYYNANIYRLSVFHKIRLYK